MQLWHVTFATVMSPVRAWRNRRSSFTESWGNDITMLENELDSLESESGELFSSKLLISDS
jgi:hypothetical protein